MLDQVALTTPFMPTSCGEVYVGNNGNGEEWYAIRGSDYLDVLRALMVDAATRPPDYVKTSKRSRPLAYLLRCSAHR
jgi:hypothetical protein